MTSKMMIEEAVTDLKASRGAVANAVAASLARAYGDDASDVADMIVARVQHYRRMPPKDYAPRATPDSSDDRPTPYRLWRLAAAALFAAALFFALTLRGPSGEVQTGAGWDICTTWGC